MMVTIPVVAHRLFGTRVRREVADPAPERAIVSVGPRQVTHLPGLWSSELYAPTTVWITEIDRSHGTRRTTDEIAAFFAPDPALAYTRGTTVNDIWSPLGVEFRLVETVEHAIDNDLADMMSQDTRVYYPLAERLGRRNAVNLFLVRALVGAIGRSGGVYAARDRYPAYAFLSDIHDLSLDFFRWQYDNVVLAHEFGHLFGLPHMPDARNLMQPAAGVGATAVTLTQRRIIEARAPGFPTI